MPRRSSVLPPDSSLARLLLVAAIFAASPVAAETGSGTAANRLQDVEGALQESAKHQAEVNQEVESLSADVAALRSQMIATAAAIQSYEEGLSAIEIQIAELDAEAEATREELTRRGKQYAAMLDAMLRFARNPPEAALLMPASPIDTVRGAIVMRAALAPLQSGIRQDWEDLGRMAELREKITREQDEKLAAATNLKAESAHLDGLFARMVQVQKRALSDSTETAQRLAKLSGQAKDLKELLARLEAQQPKKHQAGAKKPQVASLAPLPQGTHPFSAARGRLALPARGRVVHTFGQPTAGGLASRGVTIATRAGGRVVAPYDGSVVFAGPFRGYGQLLIIAQGEGYHILLAGLSRIDCVVGQWLLAGEPVGIMGPADNGDPQLYVELRHGGEPINPLPWIAAHDEKVNG